MAIYWTYQDTGSTSFDDATRIATEYDTTGQLIGDRPYTAAENASADAVAQGAVEAANKSTIEANLDADLDAMQAIIDQTNAELRADPSQEIKDIAKAVRRLTRMALDDFSGTE